MLEELLNIKRSREAEAITRFGEAKREHDRLQLACQQKERELADYGPWRKQQEERLYGAMHGRKLSCVRLQSYRQRISLLRSRELQLEDGLAKARQAVEVADRDLARTRRKQVEARREVVRFEEYQARLNELEERKAERLEELETEELATALL